MTPVIYMNLETKKLESVVTLLAWNLADKIVREEIVRACNLLSTKNQKNKTPLPPRLRVLRTKILLDSKKGLWDRGNDSYKVLGRGNEPDTYVLRKLSTDIVITSNVSTLAFRWRHTP